MSVTRRWRWAQRLQRRTATAPSDLLLRLRQIAAECGDIETEYLHLTGPLSQGMALAGVAPMPADLDRIADNRTRASRVERERRELLLAVTIAHRTWSELLEWFDLTPLLEVASPPLSVDWSPQASRYRERVLLRVAFTPEGEARAARIMLDRDLLTTTPDAAAMHDLMASVVDALAGPHDRAGRDLARALRLRGPESLLSAYAGDLSIDLRPEGRGGRMVFLVERRDAGVRFQTKPERSPWLDRRVTR